MPVHEIEIDEQAVPAETIVWLVEDNEFFRSTIKSLLDQSRRFSCPHAFSSCEDALAAFEDEIHPDIILLDIALEGMSGIEGIAKFKEVSPSTQIIILTVYDDDEKVFDALCAGASGYLLKTSPKDKIIEAVSEVLTGGAPMNPQIARKLLKVFSQIVPPKADYGLTGREKEILQLMVEGLTKKKIADRLFLSYHTVNSHLKNIYSKLHVNTRSGAVSKVFRERII